MTTHAQLVAYVLRHHGKQLTPLEVAKPWTYLHREWRDDSGDINCECVGVLIERDTGPSLRVNVADMQDFPP